MKRKFSWKIFVISLLVVFVILGLGGTIFTSNNTNSEWYYSIKPAITPPNFVFPIVWNVLFALIGLSLYFAWMKSKTDKNKKNIVIVFGINFILNIVWSCLFFGLKATTWAFVEIIIMWLSILAMILVTRKISKVSSCLLVPYLIWVAFAAVINGIVVFG